MKQHSTNDFVIVSGMQGAHQISVTDASGNSLAIIKGKGPCRTIDLSRYNNGIYFLKIEGDSTYMIIKE